MKILHVFDHSIPIQDGYSYRSLNILEQQRAMGLDTAHVTSAKHGPTNDGIETFDGLEFYRTRASDAWWAKRAPFDQLGVVMTLKVNLERIVESEQPDVLHVHSPPLNGLAALGVAKRRGIPLVYEVRAFWEDAAVDQGACREGDLRYRLTRALETYVMRNATRVTCICEGLRNDIARRGIPKECLTVIPNAVDVSKFTDRSPRDERLAEEFGLTPGRTVGFVGSFYAYEGLGLLVDAAPMIRDRYRDLRILLVGGGVETDQLRESVRRRGLEDTIFFTGRVPHDQVARYYNLIDILVYPRLSMRLTELVTPLKPLEAMAQERLVVASDVGGHREMIEHGRTGILFRSDNAEDLGAAVLGLLKEPERWPKLRQYAREFVEKERNWKASVARYRDVYQGCLHNPVS